jgi:hypothetical protein
MQLLTDEISNNKFFYIQDHDRNFDQMFGK